MFKNDEDKKTIEQGITYYYRDDILVNDKWYSRLAINTHFITPNEDYIKLMKLYVEPIIKEGDIVCSSEKVVSMCQNNIIDRKDVKVGFFARFLSKFASSNSYGIAMDEPLKLQLAINMCGLPRIIFASLASAVSKIFGIRGVFYKIAGNGVAGIDGFYANSSFDYYKSHAILNPINPDSLCNEVYEKLKISLMIVDANDLSIEILGKSDSIRSLDEEYLKDLIKDNPAGQNNELTPFIIIRELEEHSYKYKKEA